MYCTSLGALTSAPCKITSSPFFIGRGPYGLAKEVFPFPFVTQILLLINFTLVGNQPTGIKPLGTLFPGVETSKTAKQLLSAFAIYKLFLIGSIAKPFVVEPDGEFGYKATSKVSITFLVFKLITDTVLSFALHT